MPINKYIKAVTYNFGYFLVSSVAYLVLTPVAIRVMGGEFYGLWMILFAVGQLSVIGTLGIESIVNKFAAEVKEDENASANIISSATVIVTLVSLITAVVLFALRNWLAEIIAPSWPYQQQLKTALAVYALMIIPQFLIRVFHGFFLSRILNRFVRLMDLLNSLLPMLGGVLLSLYLKDLRLLAGWNLLISLVVLAIYILTTRRVIRLRWIPTRPTIRRMLGFSMFMFLESAAITLFQQFDRLLVALTLGPAASGVYSVATGVGLRLSIVAGNVTEVLVPYASRMHSLGEKLALEATIKKVSHYIRLIAALLGGLLILWVKELLSIWISPQYAADHSMVFGIIVLAYGILSLSRPAHQTLVGLGKVKFTSIIYLLASVLMLASVYLLSRRYGLAGAAAANLVMTLLLCMNVFLYAWFNRRRAWKGILSDLVIGILPMIVSLVILDLGLPWPYKLIFSLVFITVVLVLLFKDSDFSAGVRQLFRRSGRYENSEDHRKGRF